MGGVSVRSALAEPNSEPAGAPGIGIATLGFRDYTNRRLAKELARNGITPLGAWMMSTPFARAALAPRLAAGAISATRCAAALHVWSSHMSQMIGAVFPGPQRAVSYATWNLPAPLLRLTRRRIFSTKPCSSAAFIDCRPDGDAPGAPPAVRLLRSPAQVCERKHSTSATTAIFCPRVSIFIPLRSQPPRLSVRPPQQAVGLVVVGELLLDRVPRELALEGQSDVADVADRRAAVTDLRRR